MLYCPGAAHLQVLLKGGDKHPGKANAWTLPANNASCGGSWVLDTAHAPALGAWRKTLLEVCLQAEPMAPEGANLHLIEVRLQR